MTDLLSTSAFTVHPVAPAIGAEISGIDLADELGDEAIAGIRRALLAHRVLFFRDQDLDHVSHIAFARRFGELTYAHPLDSTPPTGHPEIFTVDREKVAIRREASNPDPLLRQVRAFPAWHSDVTPAVNPPFASILRADVLTDVGGDTHWTSLVAAYEGLSAPVREFVDGLRAEHRYYGLGAAKSALVTHHPVVRVIGETGERALLVTPGFTSHVLGLSADQSRAVLDLLFEQLIRTEHIVRLRWKPGTVAMWDNRTTAHLAPRDIPANQERRLYRVTVAGDVPIGTDRRPSESVEGAPFGSSWTVRDTQGG